MFICPGNRLFAAPVLHLDTSVIMSSTLESDIYNPSEQLEVVATSNYLCPYLPDLKNYLLTMETTVALRRGSQEGLSRPGRQHPSKPGRLTMRG